MDTNKTSTRNQIAEIAARIKEMREILGMTEAETAERAEVTLDEYKQYETGTVDLPFTFIYKCSLAFGIGLTDLLEGDSARLTSYTVTRRGKGQLTAREDGIEISNLAPMFRQKIAEPYWAWLAFSVEPPMTPPDMVTLPVPLL